ncbi:lipoprotein, partial [Candidatus Magnetomorum sp. HK-1]
MSVHARLSANAFIFYNATLLENLINHYNGIGQVEKEHVLLYHNTSLKNKRRPHMTRSSILSLCLLIFLTLPAIIVHAATFTISDWGEICGVSPTIAFGDYDNDGDLDALNCDVGRNDGTNTFIDMNMSPQGFSELLCDYPLNTEPCYINPFYKWADVNGDGFLDICGYYIYLNNITNFSEIGTFFDLTDHRYHTMIDFDRNGSIDYSYKNLILLFENGEPYDEPIEFVSELQGNSVWGDYDNDGDLDLMMLGPDDGNVYSSKLYRNVNGVAVEDTNITFPDCNFTRASWGDSDNDGDLDLMFLGYNLEFSFFVRLYRNDNGVLVYQSDFEISGFTFSYDGGSWADFDNDGDLDILFGCRLFVNNNGVFTLAADSGLDTPCTTSMSSWGDLDNDGDMEVLFGHCGELPYNMQYSINIWMNHTIDG